MAKTYKIAALLFLIGLILDLLLSAIESALNWETGFLSVAVWIGIAPLIYTWLHQKHTRTKLKEGVASQAATIYMAAICTIVLGVLLLWAPKNYPENVTFAIFAAVGLVTVFFFFGRWAVKKVLLTNYEMADE